MHIPTRTTHYTCPYFAAIFFLSAMIVLACLSEDSSEPIRLAIVGLVLLQFGFHWGKRNTQACEL